MVRAYKKSDKGILDVWSQSAFHTKLSDDGIDFIYIFEEKIRKGFISFRVFYERAELTYLYVDEKYRNENIASTLLVEMCNILKQKNVETVTLEVSVQNICAIHVYEKIGFKKIGKRKNYYDGIDAFLMIKEVN
jgi:ribosomal-protein-alanine N-acetyltransferase